MNRPTCRTMIAALALSVGMPPAKAADLPANAQNHDPVIHAAPAGNDAHPGTKDKPFERIGLKREIPPQGRP